MSSTAPLHVALASLLACGCGTTDILPCRDLVEQVEQALTARSFDSERALADLEARGDTATQAFVIVYNEGPSEEDMAQFREWDAHASYPISAEPWLEVHITVAQATLLLEDERVDRIVPGALDCRAGA